MDIMHQALQKFYKQIMITIKNPFNFLLIIDMSTSSLHDATKSAWDACRH